MPNLMKSLKLLFQCSPFYNTYSRMTVLLVKVIFSKHFSLILLIAALNVSSI